MKQSDDRKQIERLIDFLKKSPTAWHCIEEIAKQLKIAGFRELKEGERWNLSFCDRFFTVRNGSSLIACVVSEEAPSKAIVCASHTDSPALKLKPHAAYYKEGMLLLGVDLYGSPLLTSWLNRDLGIAGRVVYKDGEGCFAEALVNITDTPLTIPQLAIHLDREVNQKGLLLNRQEHLAALAAIGIENESAAKEYLEELIRQELHHQQLYSCDLFLYPLEIPRQIGHQKEMLAAYRIDSLSSVHAILEAFLAQATPAKRSLKMCAFWDNEEIGSATAQGAESPFFKEVLERVMLSLKMDREDYLRMIPSSLCISVDLAHALHPNYSDRHEPQHKVLLGKGTALKYSPQQRYASDARSAGAIVALAQKGQLQLQESIARADIPSGSTIGPLHAHTTGMPTVDIGTPQLSMHGCRELIACCDHIDLIALLEIALAEGTW